jgi:hypothetical protein
MNEERTTITQDIGAGEVFTGIFEFFKQQNHCQKSYHIYFLYIKSEYAHSPAKSRGT